MISFQKYLFQPCSSDCSPWPWGWQLSVTTPGWEYPPAFKHIQAFPLTSHGGSQARSGCGLSAGCGDAQGDSDIWGSGLAVMSSPGSSPSSLLTPVLVVVAPGQGLVPVGSAGASCAEQQLLQPLALSVTPP